MCFVVYLRPRVFILAVEFTFIIVFKKEKKENLNDKNSFFFLTD